MGSILAFPAAVLAYFARMGWVRSIALFVGGGFAFVLLFSMVGNAWTYFDSPPAPQASEEFHKEHKHLVQCSVLIDVMRNPRVVTYCYELR